MAEAELGGEATAGSECRMSEAPGEGSSVLKIGEMIIVKSKIFGRYRNIKDALMIAHRSCWNTVAVRGVLVHKFGKGRWMVNWDVCGEKFAISMNGDVLMKNLVEGSTSTSPVDGNAEDMQVNDGFDREFEECMIEMLSETECSDQDEEVFAPPPTGCSLSCTLDQEVLQWQNCRDGVVEDQRVSMGFVFTKSSIKWPAHIQRSDFKSPMDCWETLFPWQFFFGRDETNGSCLKWTNDSLPSDVPPFTVHEFLQFIGILFARSIYFKGSLSELWSIPSEQLIRSPEVGKRYNVDRRRFEMWQKYVKLCPPSQMMTCNAFDQIRPLVKAFNNNRKDTVRAGTELYIDESLGRCRPQSEYTSGHLLRLANLTRNPREVGCEYRMLLECTLGLVLFLEVQEGKEIMEQKTYSPGCPRHTSLVMRLAHNYLDKGHVIYGDSGISSVSTARTLLSRKTFFTGLLKQCSAGFPKRYLYEEAWDATDPRGKTQTVSLDTVVDGKTYKIYGHAWNESGRKKKPKKVLISTWNTTQDAIPHARTRVKINGTSGKKEKYTINVPRTEMVKSYFRTTALSDAQEQLREDLEGLEHSIGIRDWRFRMLCTILGLIEADAFKLYSACNPSTKDVVHQLFTEHLATQLLKNQQEGCSIQLKCTNPGPQGSDSNSDSSSDDVIPQPNTHLLELVSSYMLHEGVSLTQPKKETHSKRVRCRICRGKDGMGCLTITCCSLCSKKSPDKRPYGICGPTTGRKCFDVHLAAQNNGD
eukprot:768604-Hanusia_phi.AAC.4